MKKFALLVAAAAMAGCGLSPDASLLGNQSPTGTTAMSTQGLEAGWTSIHKAIFNKIDANHNGMIDEDEAAQYLTLNDFMKADVDHDDAINYAEFMLYATKGGFLQGNDTEQKFVSRLRNQLGGIFNHLDANHDSLLSSKELSTAALTKEGLSFYYPNLHISFKMKTVTPSEFTAADTLGTKLLSQAEFEDLYVQMVVDGLNPPPAPAPAPASASAPATPANAPAPSGHNS